MTREFKTIGLIGKPKHPETTKTLIALHNFLTTHNYKVIVDSRVSQDLNMKEVVSRPLMDLGEEADLAVVVGGDGNMLGAGRVLSRFDIAVIGVNRGNLGFLTDLDPEAFDEHLLGVLKGEYISEKRILLNTSIYRYGMLKGTNLAFNETILHPGKIPAMIEFEVYIDDSLMLSQRADGLLVSTPTGSTAYSLSAGGPIVSPNLEAISLMAMFPHTLSSRPIVISANSTVRLVVSLNNEENMMVSCDGHVHIGVLPGDEIIIKRDKNSLHLIHPKSYDYFKVLREKLGWGSKLF